MRLRAVEILALKIRAKPSVPHWWTLVDNDGQWWTMLNIYIQTRAGVRRLSRGEGKNKQEREASENEGKCMGAEK